MNKDNPIMIIDTPLVFLVACRSKKLGRLARKRMVKKKVKK